MSPSKFSGRNEVPVAGEVEEWRMDQLSLQNFDNGAQCTSTEVVDLEVKLLFLLIWSAALPNSEKRRLARTSAAVANRGKCQNYYVNQRGASRELRGALQKRVLSFPLPILP